MKVAVWAERQGSGKHTIGVNLSLALTQMGLSVVLVEAGQDETTLPTLLTLEYKQGTTSEMARADEEGIETDHLLLSPAYAPKLKILTGPCYRYNETIFRKVNQQLLSKAEILLWLLPPGHESLSHCNDYDAILVVYCPYAPNVIGTTKITDAYREHSDHVKWITCLNHTHRGYRTDPIVEWMPKKPDFVIPHINDSDMCRLTLTDPWQVSKGFKAPKKICTEMARRLIELSSREE